MRSIGLVAAARRGYWEAATAERAAFGMLSSFGGTVVLARAVTYVQERRRSVPVLRSLLRRAYGAVRQDDTRVHHFVPGIGIAFSAGAAAILTRTQDAELRYAIPFRVGAALTLDELALLIDVDNPYWGTQREALTKAALTGIAAGVLGARFAWRGWTLVQRDSGGRQGDPRA
jgi:hypothetical protein